MTRSVASLLFPGVEELDFVGPWEIFGSLQSSQPDACAVFTVSEHGGEVRCARGLQVLAQHSFATAPHADLLVVPGGRGIDTEVDNPSVIAYVRQVAAAAEVTTSVCTGAFLLERAGLLDGKQVTTHWTSLDGLRALGTVEVVAGRRWIDAGSIVTAAGVSAGIDMALYLVGRLWGPEVARRVQKDVEYFPDPPYADVPIPAKA